MAVQGNSGVSDQKQKGAFDDTAYINAENMQSNMKVIYYCRTFMSIIGGVIAGILGFTGLTGFIFYFLVMAVTSLGLTAKAKFSIHSYFDGWNRVLLEGFLGGLLSFVLFWTVLPTILCTFFNGLYSTKKLSTAAAATTDVDDVVPLSEPVHVADPVFRSAARKNNSSILTSC